MPGFVIWFTGLPASGKTTLARAIQDQLKQEGHLAVLVDSDAMRRILTPRPVYTAAERDHFYRSLGDIAAWLSREGVNVLIAATANERRFRARARAKVPRFMEVYVSTPLAVCQKRDPKGIYAAAAAGVAPAVPGVGATYEPPLRPDVEIDLSTLSPTAAAEIVLRTLALPRIGDGKSPYGDPEHRD